MRDFLEKPMEKTELVLDKIMHRTEDGLDAFMRVPRVITDKFMDLVQNSIDKLYETAGPHTSLGRLQRHLSLPWSILIPKLYKYLYSNQYNRALIFRPGVHMVWANVGGGKSLLSYVLAEMHRLETGLCSYFTAAVEKVRISEDGQWKYVYHRVINTSNYYSKGKKILNFNTKKYPIWFKDERHLDYTPRMNKTKEYNDTFVPEHKDELVMRHLGFTHIYKFTQHPRLDLMEMETLTYMHEVTCIKDIPVPRWLASGGFDVIPVRLKIETFKVQAGFDGIIKRKRIQKCNIDVPFEVLNNFDTYSERNRSAGLSVDFT